MTAPGRLFAEDDCAPVVPVREGRIEAPIVKAMIEAPVAIEAMTVEMAVETTLVVTTVAPVVTVVIGLRSERRKQQEA